MRRFNTLGLSFFGIIVLAAPLVTAQSLDHRHKRDRSVNPSDLHFHIRIAGAGRGFHLGERIPITLEFSSDTPSKYLLNGATYDRSGRLPTEEFVLDRTDVADPYSDYYFVGVLGGLMGGGRARPFLGEVPYRIELDLNDWLRFDRPGIYRLYLKSHRLRIPRVPGEPGPESEEFPAVSNIVEVTILPDDPVWASAKLGAIASILAGAEPPKAKSSGLLVQTPPLEEKLRLARRELRFLATPEALVLGFEDARKWNTSPDMHLLLGVRDRARATAEFDRYLADRSTSVRSWDLQVRALLTYVQKESPKPLAAYPWQLADGAKAEDNWAEADRRQKHFQDFVRAEALRLIPPALTKDEPARKVSGRTIAAVAPDEARAALLVPPEDFGLSRAELIGQFPAFPEEQQAELLDAKWDLVRGVEMIPALKILISRAPPGNPLEEGLPLQVWGRGGGIGETALRRLNELSPEDAFRLVAADIAGGNTRFASFAFRVLQTQTIPEADGVFKRWLQDGKLAGLPLIGKFGSANLARAMIETYRSRTWSCADDPSFITFFLRNLPAAEPESAAAYLRQALANRQGRGCPQFLLTEVAHAIWTPVLEAEAVRALEDPDVDTAISAARALSANGSPTVEQHLWKRLERWSQTWRGRTAEFAVHPIRGGGLHPERRIGAALFDAISSAKAWRLDPDRRLRLSRLCLDDDCGRRWGNLPPPDTYRLDVANGGSSFPPSFQVENYRARTLSALQEKLLQYPRGTTFRWCPHVSSPFDRFTPGQREDMYRQLKSALEENGLQIEPYSEKICERGSR